MVGLLAVAATVSATGVVVVVFSWGLSHTGDVRRMIRSAGKLCKIHRLLVRYSTYIEWLILNERVQPSLIAGVEPPRTMTPWCDVCVVFGGAR